MTLPMKVNLLRGVTAVLLMSAINVMAANHALVVGVSNYPNLREKLQLKGPENDVELVREYLQQRGFASDAITVLSEKGGKAKWPTRENILNQLTALAKTAKKGDFVYVHLAGHGSQMPTVSGRPTAKEPDGLDEIFLPRDIGVWDGSKGSLPNAIRDDELGSAFAEIRKNGAFLWAVFDNCHSGGITRAAGVEISDGVRDRQVAPTQLGIPDSVLKAAGTVDPARPIEPVAVLVDSAKDDPSWGRYVYFYAAQASQTTPEMNLPAGAEDRKPYGLFTHYLFTTIALHPDASYRQISDEVLSKYASENVRMPTPLFEGSGLDAPVFGQSNADRVNQWVIQKVGATYKIAAGSLYQFGRGALFAVYPSAAAKAGTELGYLQAKSVDVMQSVLAEPTCTPSAAGALPEYCEKKLSLSQIPNKAVARLVDPAFTFDVAVGLPSEKDIPQDQKYLALTQALAAMKAPAKEKERPQPLNISWVKKTDPQDIRLEVSDGKLWLLPPSGEWFKTGPHLTPSIDVTNKDAMAIRDALMENLVTIGRVRNLMRIGTYSAGSATAQKLVTRFYITRVKPEVRAARAAENRPLNVDDCKDVAREKEEVQLLGASLPVLLSCDQIRMDVENRGNKPVDVTVLAVDSQFGISLLYPLSRSEANRVESGSLVSIGGPGAELFINTQTVGQERLLVVGVEAEPQSPSVNVGFLEQKPLQISRGGSTTRGGSSALSKLLDEATTGGSNQTRGVGTVPVLGETAIKSFGWITQ